MMEQLQNEKSQAPDLLEYFSLEDVWNKKLVTFPAAQNKSCFDVFFCTAFDLRGITDLDPITRIKSYSPKRRL